MHRTAQRPVAETAQRSLANGGRPLSASERAYFEPRFAADLAAVRLHTGPAANVAARGLGARAFALGTDIASATPTLAPRTLAHELAHVVQGGGDSVLRREPDSEADELDLIDTYVRKQNSSPMTGTLGAELAFRNPEGFTLMVPNNFDNAKMAAAEERIVDPLDRGIGIRGLPGNGSTSRTDDLRARDRSQFNDYVDTLTPAQRATIGRGAGRNNIDHTVELQMIIRQRPGVYSPGADRVRPQDYNLQDATVNQSQGAGLNQRNIRQTRPDASPKEEATFDTPAGGIARERDFRKFWNSPAYRSVLRGFGFYNLGGGTVSSVNAMGDDIREGQFGSATVNASAAAGGMLEIGGIAAKSANLLKFGRVLGAPAALVSSGVIGVRIGTNLYQNYVDKEKFMTVGASVEKATGSRYLGGLAAADTAVLDAAYHAPEAAYDYAGDTWTVHPSEVDWDRTLKPWKWL